MTEAQLADLADACHKLEDVLNGVVRGQREQIRLLLSAFLTGGHVLLEDYPGTGKTTLAKALAKSISLDFQRVQFTPDLLPTDILGVSIYNPQSQLFEIHRGPIFTEILLADEINRASPRTQSALLESMGERQISIDGTNYPLEPHFFVIATQNPVEFHGTYPLPEAQMDRFAMRLSLGYVDLETELEIMTSEILSPALDNVSAVGDAALLHQFSAAASSIEVAKELQRYIVALSAATRQHPALRLGASPRASINLMRIAQALAILDGTGYVIPDHVQTLARPILAHRLVLDNDSEMSGRTQLSVLDEIIDRTPVPR